MYMESYKIQYNNLLNRYKKGIEYLEGNPDKLERWENELFKIMDELSNIIIQHNIKDDKIISEGFTDAN